MNILTSDFEITIYNKGNPFDLRNKAICLGVKWNNENSFCDFNIAPPFWSQEKDVKNNDLCLFFNAKFDLHWYRKLGVDVSSWKIWCCQIAEFILSGQTVRFPSLQYTALKYNLGHKIDTTKEEYWNKGIDTDKIPVDVLSDYCKQDVELTYKIYLEQLKQFQEKPVLFKLFKLLCQDCLILEEMEWNGLKYDIELCHQRSKELNTEITSIQKQLASVYPDIDINFNSGDMLSAFLYGGTIKEEGKEEIGTFKTGERKGQIKYKNMIIEHQLPRLITPLKNSELKKKGFYKTDENTLKKLKGIAASKFVGSLLRLAEIQKLDGTYYKGLPKLAKEFNWEPNYLHGQFHQVVTQTGRLSSSKPNQQNFANECLDIFVSRYND